jgi:hypothetical protein
LWEAADRFRANSGLTAAQYSQPVPGLIFLRFAEVRFAAQRAKLDKAGASSRRGSRLDEPAAYHAGALQAEVLGGVRARLRELSGAGCGRLRWGWVTSCRVMRG